MSSWMSIGFDPDQMDPVAQPDAQAAFSRVRDHAAPRQTGRLGQATPSEPGAVSGLNGSSKHGIAGALKRLVTRHRAFGVPELKL